MLTAKGWSFVAIWAMAALCIIVLQITGVDLTVRGHYSNAVNTVAAFACGVFCFRTAFAFPPGNPMVKIWGFLGAGMLFWGTGQMIYTIYMVLFDGAETPYPYYSDYCFTLMFIFLITSLFLFQRNIKRASPAWGKVLSVVLFSLGLTFAFYMQAFSGEGLALMVSSMHTIFITFTMAQTTLILSSLFGRRIPAFCWCLASGVLLNYLADQVYIYLLYQELYYSGIAIDMMWVIAFGLISTSAMMVFNQYTALSRSRQQAPANPAG